MVASTQDQTVGKGHDRGDEASVRLQQLDLSFPHPAIRIFFTRGNQWQHLEAVGFRRCIHGFPHQEQLGRERAHRFHCDSALHHQEGIKVWNGKPFFAFYHKVFSTQKSSSSFFSLKDEAFIKWFVLFYYYCIYYALLSDGCSQMSPDFFW